MRRLTVSLLLLAPFASTPAFAWPNGPDEDPTLDRPNDPGFFRLENGKPKGDWNMWSSYPDAWKGNIKDPWEKENGPGLHADRAWQVTTGDRRVIIAVHDSGAYWDNRDLVNKWYLNRNELANCKPTGLVVAPPGSDEFDVNASGWFDIRDYTAGLGEVLGDWDQNHNGMIDPEDLILKCSDGVDNDGNGYIDDISGWDFFADDNNAYDDTRFGHGNGEARDSSAEGNNGDGGLGVCPDCTVMMVRVGDSFVTDVNNFAQGVVFSVDTGASVIQSALGAVNYTQFSRQAIDYAYTNGVAFVASAADELSYHHNFPGSGEHSIYVHAIQFDDREDTSTTFMNFNNCTNYGMQLLLSTPGTGCSSEAVGMTSGHVGLIYAAALKYDTTPPLSAEEVKQILTMSADDIVINPNDDDPEKYPSRVGWDWHFGYGRNNARNSVDMVRFNQIPPEAYINDPQWFQVIDPAKTPSIPIDCRINERVDGLPSRYSSVTWTLEYATGVAPGDEEFHEIAHGTDNKNGKCADWDVTQVDLDLDKKVTDPHQNAVVLRLRVESSNGAGDVVKGDHRKGLLFHKDPDVRDGFPKNLKTSAESSPIFANIDGKDNDEELVLFASDGQVHVWQQDGSELAGFPVKVGFRPAMEPTNPKNNSGSCGYRDDKTGCKRTLGKVEKDVARQTAMMPLAIGDIDKDGDLEIVVSTWDGFVFVYENDGSLRPGWPKGLDYTHVVNTSPERIIEAGFFASPVLYDLDQQGGLEIILAGMDQYVYVWHDDGTTLAPYPVRLYNKDDAESTAGADRIVSTPAVGDIDGDGKPEIALGSSEVYGSDDVEIEATAYVLEAETGTVADGWPVTLYGVMVNVLPTVGRGVVANPMLADLDFDGKLEIAIDTIASPGNIYRYDGDEYRFMNNEEFGPNSNSTDTPTYILMNNGAFGNIDNEGGIDMVKGSAGFNFALAFVGGGGKRQSFDHHMSGWDTDTGKMMKSWPRVHDDWQFFNTPTIVDLNGDAYPEVVVGSGGYLLHAWDRNGDEPTGWPKQTGGWIIASAAVGDFDGDQKFDVSVSTRDGWLFAWKTDGSVHNTFQWAGFGHDPHHTNNFENDPTPYQTWDDTPVVEPDPQPEQTPEQGAETSEPTTATATAEAEVEVKGGKDDGCNGAGAGASLLLVGLALVALRRRYV